MSNEDGTPNWGTFGLFTFALMLLLASTLPWRRASKQAPEQAPEPVPVIVASYDCNPKLMLLRCMYTLQGVPHNGVWYVTEWSTGLVERRDESGAVHRLYLHYVGK